MAFPFCLLWREATLLHLVEISRPSQAVRVEKHAFRFIGGSFQPVDEPRR